MPKNPIDLIGFHQDPHFIEAILLANLGNTQRGVRELVAAQETYSTALRIYQELASQHPGEFHQYLAVTFNQLGSVQRDLGEFAIAHESFSTALRIYQELASQHPGEFHQYLAVTFNQLGSVQRDLGEFAIAHESFSNALRIYKELAMQRPGEFRQYLAVTFNQLGNVQRDLREYTAALESFSAAAHIFRELAAQRPVFRRYLAETFNSLGNVQSDLARYAVAHESFLDFLPAGSAGASESLILPELHDSANGQIDAQKMANFVRTSLKRLSEGLGLNYDAVGRSPSDARFQDALRPVKRILELLQEFFGSDESTRKWLNAPHPDLGGSSALQTILDGRADAVTLILDNAWNGVPV